VVDVNALGGAAAADSQKLPLWKRVLRKLREPPIVVGKRKLLPYRRDTFVLMLPLVSNWVPVPHSWGVWPVLRQVLAWHVVLLVSVWNEAPIARASYVRLLPKHYKKVGNWMCTRAWVPAE